MWMINESLICKRKIRNSHSFWWVQVHWPFVLDQGSVKNDLYLFNYHLWFQSTYNSIWPYSNWYEKQLAKLLSFQSQLLAAEISMSENTSSAISEEVNLLKAEVETKNRQMEEVRRRAEEIEINFREVLCCSRNATYYWFTYNSQRWLIERQIIAELS